MEKQIFINFAVNDLQRSMDFYSALGFSNNPQFSDYTIFSKDNEPIFIHEALVDKYLKKNRISMKEFLKMENNKYCSIKLIELLEKIYTEEDEFLDLFEKDNETSYSSMYSE